MVWKKETLQRRQELRALIAEESSRHQVIMYDYIRELYEIEVKHNPIYTHGELAVSLGMADTYLYSILAWKRATAYVKKAVADKKISRSRACRILYRAPSGKGEMMIKRVITLKLNSAEIDAALKKSNIKNNTEELIEERREYRNNNNLIRDIKTYSSKLLRSLLSIQNIPKPQKTNIKLLLVKTADGCQVAIDRIEKNGW